MTRIRSKGPWNQTLGAAIALMSTFSYMGPRLDEHVRPVAWLGDSRKQVRNFPPEVRRSIGSALYDAQKAAKRRLPSRSMA